MEWAARMLGVSYESRSSRPGSVRIQRDTGTRTSGRCWHTGADSRDPEHKRRDQRHLGEKIEDFHDWNMKLYYSVGQTKPKSWVLSGPVHLLLLPERKTAANLTRQSDPTRDGGTFCRLDLKHIHLYICRGTSRQCLCKCAGTRVRERTGRHLTGRRQRHGTQSWRTSILATASGLSGLTWARCQVCVQHVSVMTHANVRVSVIDTDVLAAVISLVACGWTWGTGDTWMFKTASSAVQSEGPEAEREKQI